MDLLGLLADGINDPGSALIRTADALSCQVLFIAETLIHLIPMCPGNHGQHTKVP